MAKAFGALHPLSPPCHYVNAAAWANIHEACTGIIERFVAEVVRLGGTAPQLFGVHPEHGTLRVDWCGVMITGGHKAISIEPNRILSGNVRGYRNVPGAPNWIPICECAARTQKT